MIPEPLDTTDLMPSLLDELLAQWDSAPVGDSPNPPLDHYLCRLADQLVAHPLPSATPAAPPPEPRYPFLRFQAAGLACALPLRDVLRVDRLPRVTPVPGTPDSVRGLANLRGQLITLVSLRDLFDKPAPPVAGERLLVVPGIQGRGTLGLIVDSLAGIAGFTSAQLSQPAPSPLQAAAAHTIRLESARIEVLDLQKLHDAMEVSHYTRGNQ